MTTQYDPTEVSRLLELRRRATPGPWVVEKQGSDDWNGTEYITGHITAEAHTYAVNESRLTKKNSVTSEDTMTADDAEFIAAAHPIASQLEAASVLLERCREYLEHDFSSCEKWSDSESGPSFDSEKPCTCGLADLLNQIEGKK